MMVNAARVAMGNGHWLQNNYYKGMVSQSNCSPKLFVGVQTLLPGEIYYKRWKEM